MLGNGDVDSYENALTKTQQYGVDRVMIGTEIFKNPWLFNSIKSEITTDMRIDTVKKHILLFNNKKKNRGGYNISKRFFKIYLTGFEGAATLRKKLMQTSNCDEGLEVIKLM